MPIKEPALAIGRSIAGNSGDTQRRADSRRRSRKAALARTAGHEVKPISRACHSGALQAVPRGKESEVGDKFTRRGEPALGDTRHLQ